VIYEGYASCAATTDHTSRLIGPMHQSATDFRIGRDDRCGIHVNKVELKLLALRQGWWMSLIIACLALISTI
jgi:hypothetical protein